MSLERLKSKLAAAALIPALAAVPLGAGVAYLALPAQAQTTQSPTPPPPPGPRAQNPGGMRGISPGMHGMGPGMRGIGPGMQGVGGRGPGGHGPWGERFAHMEQRHEGGNWQMRLAGKLAAVETAIGVRSDQLDAWRDFTSKLVAFATPPWQQDRGPGMNRAAAAKPPMKAGNPQGDATPPDMPPANDSGKGFGILDRIVDRAIQRGDEAKQLKDSMQKLKSVLTPQQMQTAWMLMRPDGGMRRGWGDRDHMGRGDHGARLRRRRPRLGRPRLGRARPRPVRPRRRRRPAVSRPNGRSHRV